MPRRLRLSSILLSAVCAALRLTAQPADAPVLPLDDLRPGQTGEVWTVFQGNKPEAFSVKVTGVVRNALGPGKNMILCELTDPRVQSMGAVAGMSGSPLYIDGKVAGVLSYQIQRFETVRYAGFTPISDMLEISALPAIPTAPALPLPNPSLPVKGNRDTRTGSLAEGDLRPLQPVFAVSGIAPEVAALFEPQLQSLGLAINALGGSTTGATATGPADVSAPPPALQPGDVVSAALATGDITLAATGTVSYANGGRILAFGHPMLSLGATELPMAEAEVVTILPSQLNSVKVANTGRVIGAFSQDRLSGIYGEIGRKPAMVDVEVNLPTRLNRKSLRFAVVRQEFLLPALTATGLTQAVMGSNEAGLTKGFRLTTTITYPGLEPLRLSRVYPGPQGFAAGAGEFVQNLQQWIFNPFERTFPERIRFDVEETPSIPVGLVENVVLSRASAAPGSRVTATLSLRAFQQPAETRTVDIDVPAEWAGKDLEVVVASGPVLDDLTGQPKTPAITAQNSFADYLELLRRRRAADGLYLAVLERTPVFTDQRDQTPELPGSLARIAQAADDSRFQRRSAMTPLWETRLLDGRLFSDAVRRPLRVED